MLFSVGTGIGSFLSIFFLPWNFLLLCIIFLASIGKSLGVRKLYIKILLDMFEFGRKNIEDVTKARRKLIFVDDDDVESSNEDEGYKDEERIKPSSYLIQREQDLILIPDQLEKNDNNKFDHKEEKINFQLKHWLKSLDYIKTGIESIIEDEVTIRFEAQELKNWNFLTRTNQTYEFISWKLTFLWILGCIIRYFILLPFRLYIFTSGLIWLSLTTALVGLLRESGIKRWLNKHCYLIAFRILSRSLSAVINIHNAEWRPQKGSICVANHTSPCDCVILSNDNCYALIGQKHGGVLGLIQRALNRASPHIWFERSETRDRGLVLKKLKEHTSNAKYPPMLIFPEGTCINNTSVMQFKKGSFQVGCPIYPVAIKYDPRFGNAFWDSSKYSMIQYIFMMMTSWAIVCDVWYLPPVFKNPDENSVDYANRVKRLIALKGGLVDLVWDGQLKRVKAKKEWKEKEQEKISKVWKF